ncbi:MULTISPECIES: histidine kinase [unclassified Streptomyces]|uniref:sensor histidine kinase n=1 Tax=unclassified Streptomyces TaxID=2593676 RepID=UPI00336A73D7
MIRWIRHGGAARSALLLWSGACAPVLLKATSASGRELWLLLAGFPLLAGAAALGRTRPLVGLAVAVGLSLGLNLELYTSSYWAALALWGYLTGRWTAGARPALWFFAACSLAGALLAWVMDAGVWTWFTALTTLLLNVVVPWLLGRYRRQYDHLVHAGWELADRMEREQRAVADRARLRERSRIAGDMHDSLGHDLALIALRAGALQVDPELSDRHRAAAAELREAAAAATSQLRDIIGVLRTGEDPAPTAPADEGVGALVERAQASGLAVALEYGPECGAGGGPGGESGYGSGGGNDGSAGEAHRESAPSLPPMADRAVYRVVQEALTNAAKHAPGAAVRVQLARDPAAGEIAVSVVNGPRPADGSPPDLASGGNGLVGLDERVRLAGGVLTHGPAPDGGFAVSARLPLTAGVALVAEPASVPPSTSARELARARERVRRRLVESITVPLAVTAGLAVLWGGFTFYTQYHSVLDRGTYDRLEIGEPRADVESRMPPYTMDGPPDGIAAPPRGWDCAYYGVRRYDGRSAYRLCFADERLVAKDVVTSR